MAYAARAGYRRGDSTRRRAEWIVANHAHEAVTGGLGGAARFAGISKAEIKIYDTDLITLASNNAVSDSPSAVVLSGAEGERITASDRGKFCIRQRILVWQSTSVHQWNAG